MKVKVEKPWIPYDLNHYQFCHFNELIEMNKKQGIIGQLLLKHGQRI
jgi:hypothetical protein